MAEREIDLVLRARAITQAAFAEVDKQLTDLAAKSKTTGDQSKAAGQGLFDFSKSTKESFAAMGQAVGLAGGAVLALGAGIVALGVKGADVADVRGSFDALNKTIGNDSTKVLGTLRTAFAGTRTDFDLMKSVNVALSSGLKASATDFGLLGDASRVLSDRGLGPAEQHFDTLTKAMATGKLKQAELIIGNIDAGKAYYDYGQKIGKAKDALSEAEKVTATSIAITQRLEDSVMAGGKAQFDFADALDASKVMVGNFTDALGEAIATSPVVNAMLASFKKGLEAGFGADQAAMVQTLTGYVNKFSIFLVDVAQVAIESARFIGNAFFGLQAAFNTVMGFLTTLGEGFIDLQLTITEAARAMTLPGLRGPIDDNIAHLKELKTFVGGVGDGFRKSADDALASAATWNAGVDTVGKGLESMRAEMVKASTATVELGDKQKTAAGHTKTLETGTAELTKEQKKHKEETERATKEAEKAMKAMDDWNRSLKDLTFYGIMPGGIAIKDFDTDLDKLSGNTYGVTKKMDDWARSIKDLTAFGILPGGIAVSDLDTKVADLNYTTQTFRQIVAPTIGELAQAFGGLAQVTSGSLGTVMTHLANLTGAIGLAEKAGVTMKAGWDQIGEKGAANIVAGFITVMDGALKAATAIAKATEEGNAWERAMSGAAAGATAGSAFGTYGVLVGAFTGAVVGLGRAWQDHNSDVQNARMQVREFERMLALTATTQQTTAAGGQAWALSVIVVRDAFVAAGRSAKDAEAMVAALWDTDHPDRARAAIEQINSVIQRQKDDVTALWKEYGKLHDDMAKLKADATIGWEQMGDAAKRYGIDLASLGPKFHEGKLDDAFKTIWSDFDLLTKGGADVGGVLLGMKGKIVEMATEADRFGIQIPSNFKPLIDNLLASGKLTEDERKALGGLGAEDFGPPVKSNLDLIADRMGDVADRIKEVADALNRLLPGAAATGAELIDRSLGIIDTGVGDLDTKLRDPGPWNTFGGNATGAADAASAALRTIPRSADVDVNIRYNDPGWHPPRSEEVNVNPPESFATGGIVHAGAGQTIRAHGREAIVPLDRPSVIGRQLIREIVNVSERSGGGRDEAARLDRIEELMDRLVADNATRDGRLTRAMRDALLQAGGR